MVARTPAPAVALIGLGCGRNDIDGEELAGRLAEQGMSVRAAVGAEDAEGADVVLVNTCGFVESAKQESVQTLLEAVDGSGAAVVAVGCLAERYGEQLAVELPEVQVLSFDDYPQIADRVRRVLDGERLPAHRPVDRRRTLPIAPVARAAARSWARPVADQAQAPDLPVGLGPASGPRPVRRRLGGGPVAALKLATGCDRRCTFCAIPRFRGSFASRPPSEVLAEARWLAGQGVREVLLVSENSTSYGKDLGDLRALERLLPELAADSGLGRLRVSYLQPAELRPGLVEAIAATDGVAAYFDLSFQHASPAVLRRMRRFGGPEPFLDLLQSIRAQAPSAGVRSNVIVGFPGETEDDVATLEAFLAEARLDAIGVFGYSDEDGTEAAKMPDQIDPDEVAARVDRLATLAEVLMAERAAARIGELTDVLVLGPASTPGGSLPGLAEHQGPDVDGATELVPATGTVPVTGALVRARVVEAIGVDLRAEAVPPLG